MRVGVPARIFDISIHFLSLWIPDGDAAISTDDISRSE